MYPIAELKLNVDIEGYGLKLPPHVYLPSRPHEAEADVTGFDGKVVSVSIDDTGNGYTEIPSINIGGGASLDIVAPGTIENILNLQPGSNYIDAPNVIFQGQGIKAEALCEISGSILSVDIADAGSNYNSPPEILVEGDGFGAELEAVLSGYVYRTILIYPGLFPVDVIPPVTVIDDDGNASAVIVPIMQQISPNYSTIKELSISNEGSGYKKAPSLLIQGHVDGFEASGVCLINGGISSVNIINGGSGFKSIPKLTVVRKSINIPKPEGFGFLNHVPESPTPTQTATPTQTFTPSNTPAITATPTKTCTKTPSYTPVVTSTPTLTKTPPITPTRGEICACLPPQSTLVGITHTPTATITRSPTPTPTVTPSFTASPTVTKTQTTTPPPTVTPTSSPTMTKTCTITPTPSPTVSVTPSQKLLLNNPDIDAIIIPRMGYSVSNIKILQGGRYSTTPSIIVKPPVVAKPKALIVNPGSQHCFGSRPTVKIRGSTISSPYRKTREPEGVAIINYGIAKVDILNGGSNYTQPPTINLIGGYDPIKGIKGRLSAVISNGSVTDVSIDYIGDHYRTAPYISISSNDNGYGLQIKLTMSGILEDIYITDPGLNLTENTPNTTIFIEQGNGPIDAEAKIELTTENDPHNGEQCTATPELNYRVTGAKILDGGSNYEYSPSVTINNGAQKDFPSGQAREAKAQARILGKCTKINITDPGDKYGPFRSFVCEPLKRSNIYLYGAGYSNKISLPLNSGIISTIFDSGNYRFNPGIYDLPNNNLLFYEKPRILFGDTETIIANTYLEVSSVSVSLTGIEPDYETHYVTTIKGDNTFSQLSYLELIKKEYGTTNNIDADSLTSIHNNYASCTYTYTFGDGGQYRMNDPFMSVVGDIVGLSFSDIAVPQGYSYSSGNLYASMLAFFDTDPTLSLDDCVGSSASVGLSTSNTYTAIFWRDENIPSSYSVDGFLSNYYSSDLSINGSDYSSYATLVCDQPGTPTSWNNKPQLIANIEDGRVISVTVAGGGAGFYPQTSNIDPTKKIFEIYFTGGGGSGAYATYTTDVDSNGLSSAVGSIQEVIVVSGGNGYLSSPTPIVVDYNTTWKEFYLHNKIFDRTNWKKESPELDIEYMPYPAYGPLQLVNFYFKNPTVYETRFAVKNQSSYISNKLDSVKQGYPGSIRQVCLSTLVRPQNVIDLPKGFLFEYNKVKNRYIVEYYYNNGYVNNLLYLEDQRYVAYPYASNPAVNIWKDSDFSQLCELTPVFSTEKYSWNREMFSDTILINNFIVD